MRKTMLFAAFLVLALVIAVPAFADIEVGISATIDPAVAEDPNAELEPIPGFHLAYQWWGIFYATWDSMVLPPDLVNSLTGYLRPGFLNLFDAGIRIRLGPIIGFVTAGTNNIYVYRQAELTDFNPEFGANLRAGAGLKFEFLGVNLSVTSLFASFDRLARTLQSLAGTPAEQNAAIETITSGLIPAFGVTLYF